MAGTASVGALAILEEVVAVTAVALIACGLEEIAFDSSLLEANLCRIAARAVFIDDAEVPF